MRIRHGGPRLLTLLLLLYPCFLHAQGIRCKEEVLAQLQLERKELHAVLEMHQSGKGVDGRIYGLSQDDFNDESDITIRQRQWYRRMNPGMPPGGGPYQYPRYVYDLMNRLDFMGAAVCEDGSVKIPGYQEPFAPDAPLILANVNVTNNADLEGEDYLSIDPTNQQYLVGGSNSLTVNGQVIHRSSDYGATWATTMLVPTLTYHSDPGTAFTTTGTVYACAVDYTTNFTNVEVYKSTNHGAAWGSPPIIVDGQNFNDKELMSIDTQAASSCKDKVYVCWDNGTTLFASSTTTPDTFRPRVTVAAGGFACDIVSGPPAAPATPGPAYTAWTNIGSSSINFAKSTDCGATWSTPVQIATTVESYDYCILAQQNRKALIYPSIDADRSNGPRKGWIYASWNDLTVVRASNKCGTASTVDTANVWFSRSTDGGATWSPKVMVNADVPMSDQFNQWLRVDDADGTIHMGWHDTRNDATRVSTDFYYTNSTDGGFTFLPEIKVTSAMTNENSSTNGHQYGDYEGLAVRNGVAYPFWTDRRPSSGTDEEVFTSKICSDPKSVGSVTATDIDPCVRNGVQVTWSAPSIFWGDGGQGTRKYQLWVDGFLATDNIAEASVSTTYSPGNGTSHTYQIKAVNSCGNASAYTSASAIDALDTTPPNTSGWNSLSAAKSGGAVSLTWNSPAGDAVAYNVYRDTVPNSPFGPAQRLNGSPLGGTNYSDTPPAGTIFFYVIRALDSCSNES